MAWTTPRSLRSALALRSTVICRPNSDLNRYSLANESPVKSRAFALVRRPMRPTRTVLHSPLLRRAGAAPVQKHLEQRVVFYGLERRRQADESPDCPAAQDAPRNQLTRPKPIAFEAGLGTRYGQSQQFSIFHVPKLRRALSKSSKQKPDRRGRS